jgi:hypothetical protein
MEAGSIWRRIKLASSLELFSAIESDQKKNFASRVKQDVSEEMIPQTRQSGSSPPRTPGSK